jgi:hypothetical protein
MAKEITVELYKKSGGWNSASEYLVKRGDVVVGVLIQFPYARGSVSPGSALRPPRCCLRQARRAP